MPDQRNQERLTLAERRLKSILRAQIISTARTLEQKIADAGPNNQRINPHVLTQARKRLEASGEITPHHAEDGSLWYHLSAADSALITSRLAELLPVHAALRAQAFTMRVGQALEIAVYRALIAVPQLTTLGAYTDLDAHDDGTLYTKEEPPSTISGRSIPDKKKLDFIVTTNGKFAGIEVKNVREWLYPGRAEIQDLLLKCTTLQIVPVLIARRIPYVTFKLLTTCGAIVHQTYNQLFPASDSLLAQSAKDKTLLGFHDVRTGNVPDARLTKFVSANLPKLIESQNPVFEDHMDLLREYALRRITYKEFAARVRRRAAGTNEDSDWDEDN